MNRPLLASQKGWTRLSTAQHLILQIKFENGDLIIMQLARMFEIGILWKNLEDLVNMITFLVERMGLTTFFFPWQITFLSYKKLFLFINGLCVL